MNEVMVRGKNAPSVFETNGSPDVMKMGETVAKSGMFGQVTSSQGALIVITCNKEKLSPVEFKRRYRFVGNELTRIPNSLLGDFVAAGGQYEINRCDAEECNIDFWKPGKDPAKDKPYNCTITMEQMKQTDVPFAKDGKTLKSNWKNFPDDMLFARVTGKAMRRIWPEGASGIYMAEEVEDFLQPTEIKNVTSEELKARIEKLKGDEGAPSAPVEAQVVMPDDITVCPIPGKDCFGVRWEDFESDRLMKVLKLDAAKFPMFTDAHREEVKRILDQREQDIINQAEAEARAEAEAAQGE